MIAITGSSGTVGTALRRELTAHLVPFVSLYRTEAHISTAVASGETARIFDYQQPAGWASALSGISTLFLLGTGVEGQAEAEIALATDAVRQGVTHIVKLSVIGTDDPDFDFGRMHKSVEDAIDELGVARVFLRPNGFMQNFDEFMGTSIAAGGLYESARDAKIAFIDVRDIAAVARVVLTADARENQAITLTGPRALDHAEAAAILAAELGWPVNHVDIDDDTAHVAIVESGVDPLYANYLINLAHFYRRGGGSQATDQVESITGKLPRSFDQYVRDYRAQYEQLRSGVLAQTA